MVSMRAFLLVMAGCLVGVAVPSAEQAKADAASLAGTWEGEMDNGREGQPIRFELSVEGTKVTGTFTALSKVAVEGEFKDGVLSMTSKVRVEGHRASLVFTARFQADGSLSGTVNPQETGAFEWYATRKGPAPGSAASPSIVRTSSGTVEFLGLETWTPKMIQERLGYGSPDDLHHCAARLKAELGFADAAVVNYLGERYTVVSVVEPQHASRIRYREAPGSALATPAGWEDLRTALTDRSRWSDAKGWTARVARLRSGADFDLALDRVTRDGDGFNRAVAAALLANFPENDAAWHAIVDALRDPDKYVASEALMALARLNREAPSRAVDWAPAAASLRHVLNGTYLFGLNPTLKALVKTQVDPALAREFLRDGGSLLLSYLQASHAEERTLAAELLKRLSGRDFGADVALWREWIGQFAAA